MNVLLRQVWRRHRDGHPAHPPNGDSGRRAAKEPIFCAASRVPRGAAGTCRVRSPLKCGMTIRKVASLPVGGKGSTENGDSAQVLMVGREPMGRRRL